MQRTGQALVSLPLQMMLAPEENLYPVPDDVPDEVGAQFAVTALPYFEHIVALLVWTQIFNRS